MCPCVTECFVFVSCLSRTLLTLAGRLGGDRRGWTVAWWLVGPLGAEDSQSSTPCPYFLVSSKDSPFLPIYLFLPSFPGSFNKMQPDSFANFNSIAFCLSVGSRPSLQVSPKPCFLADNPSFLNLFLVVSLSNQLLGNTHKKLNVYITRFSFDFIRNAH